MFDVLKMFRPFSGPFSGIGIRLPAGNGGFSSVLLTAPLLYAIPTQLHFDRFLKNEETNPKEANDTFQ